MEEEIRLDDDDVIMTGANQNPTKNETFRYSQLVQAFVKINDQFTHNAASFWFGDGYPCQVLRTTGGGWQFGKIRLRIEFIPDKPTKPPQQTDS